MFPLGFLFLVPLGASALGPANGNFGGDRPIRFRDTEPCRKVFDEVAQWYQKNNIVPTDYSRFNMSVQLLVSWLPRIAAAPIRPSFAYDCLKSVPFDQDTALKYVEYLKPFLEWHSSLDYLRTPPTGYLSEPVDLPQGLSDIFNKIKATTYTNEFEFVADLYQLMTLRVRDFHFGASFPLLDLFHFRQTATFVSVSKDGTTPPEVYLFEDGKHDSHQYKPSPVHTVNGIPVAEYFGRRSLLASGSHDPDARYNSLFVSLSKQSNSMYYDQHHDLSSLKDETRVVCQNGTSFTFSNHALVLANVTGVNSGSDIFQRWAAANGTGEDPSVIWQHNWMSENFTNPFKGFPRPIHTTYDGTVAGFLTSEPEISEVVVLAVNSFFMNFNPDLDLMINGPNQRLNVTVETIRAAKAAGRTKLIIDLQGNGGGQWVNLAILFDLLFPGDEVPLLWQHRAHAQLEALAHEADRITNITGSQPRNLMPFDLTKYYKPNGAKWGSFLEHYGPIKGTQGIYTRSSLFNATAWMTNPYLTLKYVRPWTEPPFKAEDIVLLLDGECGSACAIFATGMIHGHKVRTVAVGGRPLEAPMQGVGQVKGGSGIIFPWSDASNLNLSTSPEIFTGLNPPLKTREFRFNEANMAPIDSKSGIPSQFTYEAANCKIFFTWDMHRNIETLWRKVAEVTWAGGRCVKGSTTGKNDRMGGVPLYQRNVEDRYRLEKGPGAV